MPSEIDLFREFIVGEKDYTLEQSATEQEIAAFERTYNVHLPDDVREYFLKINGIYLNGGFIALDPLEKWCLITERGYSSGYVRENVPDAHQYFQFGNYDISVWAWLIELDSDANADTPIFVLHEKLTKIADNFTDFLQKYRTGSPEDLLGYS
jgi:hypothetical protein